MDQDVSKMESYSKAFAEKACNSFFSISESIKGEQIISQTPIDQVNLFVIKNIFNRWKEEVQKLKSPYFDFESAEVKDALTIFGNVLSKHILIKKEFFRPLLEKAVFDTLLLIFKPDLHFKNEFSDHNLLVENLREKSKYYRIHRNFLDQFLEKTSKGISRDFILEFEEWIINNPLKEEEKEAYLSKFGEVLPFEISKKANEAVKFEIPQLEQKDIHQIEKPFIKESINLSKTDVQIKKGEQKSVILNEQFEANQTTINDLLRESEARSLADKISRSKLDNIRNGISLNQKFRFINFLFKGSGLEYENSLNEVEKCASYEDALNFLNNNYGLKFNWDFNNPEIKEFIDIVERRFA